VNAGNWISLAGVIIAGVSAALAVRSARRARKAESAAAEHERQALEAARDAAGHAKRSADAEERMATVVESQERREVSERSAVERFPWKLLSIPGYDDCMLHNTSRAVLYAVEVQGEKIAYGPMVLPAVGPDQQEEVLIWRVLQMDDDVLITWQIDEEDGAERFNQPLKVPSRIG
jgi:hypothetical protein